MENKNFKTVRINDCNTSNFLGTMFSNKRKFGFFKICFLITFILNLAIFIFNITNISFIKNKSKKDEILSIKQNSKFKPLQKLDLDMSIDIFLKEKDRPYLTLINKKRTFKNRLPLPREIKCKPHFTKNELIAFLSFLTKQTIYFETGSGCSSIIAKYYAQKSYAVEWCKKWYQKGVENGLKENLIFRDLKPDNYIWSYPGKKSNIEDLKKYFQSYNSSFNADVILIDGRFKVATAMDIFNKINDDTIVLIHEYTDRPMYFILEKYYQYIYHWDRLTAFVKKKEIQSIPEDVQQKYWDKFL